MTNRTLQTTVLIVGAGPVGLFLGLALQHHGIRCIVVDRRTSVSMHSRAIGVHPPSLELFARLGIAEQVLAKGQRIHKGVAYSGTRLLGEMDFRQIDGPYPHIITLPQGHTEQLLQDALLETKGNLLLGTTPEGMTLTEDGVRVTVSDEAGQRTVVTASLLVGCDGRRSWVRGQCSIPFRGGDYADRYAMGDFPDHMPSADTAYINVSSEGLVEAIPLPGRLRRWVIRLRNGITEISRDAFIQEIHRRTGERMAESSDSILDCFGVQHFVADRVAQGRVLLAGDAAHVMSPIGGQGLNVGWLDGWDLACTLAGDQDWRSYDRVVRRRAVVAIRRARSNTMLGRATGMPWIRDALIRVMLRPPLRKPCLRRFTMQGLPQLHR